MERNEEEKITDKVVKFVANILNFGEIVKICCMKGSFTIKGSEIFTQKRLPHFPPANNPKVFQYHPQYGVVQLPRTYCQYYPPFIHSLLHLEVAHIFKSLQENFFYTSLTDAVFAKKNNTSNYISSNFNTVNMFSKYV